VLMTIDLQQKVLALSVVYLIFGIMLTVYRFTKGYFVFGCKTYGSLTLALGLLTFPDWNQQLTLTASKFNIAPTNTVGVVLFTWVLFAIVVHVLGEMLFMRPIIRPLFIFNNYA